MTLDELLMKIKLGVYYRPDNLHMILITDFDSHIDGHVGAWLVICDEYFHGHVSTDVFFRDFIYLGEL